MKVAEVMTRDVVSVRPDATTAEIAVPLLEKRISAVPVVDDEGRRPVGKVSESDLLRHPPVESPQVGWLRPFDSTPVTLEEEAQSKSLRRANSSPAMCWR
jgi:CBS-domain-containing membrane protein